MLNFDSLDDLLKLRFDDKILLGQFNNGSLTEPKFLENVKSIISIGTLIRLANASPKFADACKQKEYQNQWAELYSLFGTVISSGKILFFKHNRTDNFDLIRGAYFFHQSQEVRNKLQQSFSDSEIRILKHAIQFNSVHATQCYNLFIYNRPYDEISEVLLKEAITNCKKLLGCYGSYAYMMLAEAYFHYAQLGNKEQNKAIEAAIKACDLAINNMEVSQNSIYNASLGGDLSCSNSFHFADPQEAKEYLIRFQHNPQRLSL